MNLKKIANKKLMAFELLTSEEYCDCVGRLALQNMRRMKKIKEVLSSQNQETAYLGRVTWTRKISPNTVGRSNDAEEDATWFDCSTVTCMS